MTDNQFQSEIFRLAWDEFKIIDDQARYLLAEGEAADIMQALEMAACDSDHICFEYDYFLEDFSDVLKALSPEGRFHIEGRNMGWRHLSGKLDIEAGDAQSFIARSFPRTSDWTLEGVYDPSLNCLTYRLYHHDAPSGEIYSVTGRA